MPNKQMEEIYENLRKEECGYVFPFCFELDGSKVFCPGISASDYFAAKALIAISYMIANGAKTDKPGIDGVTEEAYQIADAMLEERKK